MQKTVLLLTLILICTLATPVTAVRCQTSTPHVVAEGDIWLLSSDSGEKLFLLPNSYYAKIVSLDENYYFVTFNGVVGKISKSLVSTVGYHATATGTAEELSVSEEFLEFTSINLKQAPIISSPDVIDIPVSSTFTYIGSYPTSDGTWYYVKYKDLYGYIRSDRTTKKEIVPPTFVPEDPEFQEASAEAQDTENTEDTEEDSKSKILRIIIIVGLSIPAVLIVVLIFKPSKASVRQDEDV